MPMYSWIEYGHAYLKTSGSLWQYYRDESALDVNNYISDFRAYNNNSSRLKFKQQMTGESKNGGSKNVKIIVSLKDISKLQRILVTPLINCEITL